MRVITCDFHNYNNGNVEFHKFAVKMTAILTIRETFFAELMLIPLTVDFKPGFLKDLNVNKVVNIF